MAKAAKTTKQRASKAADKAVVEPLSIKIGLNVTEDTPVFYANHFEVGHSQREFMLNIARFPPKPSAAQMEEIEEKGAFIIEPEMQVLFPPELAVELIDALKLQIESYESRVKKIRS